ncbi:MAG: nucleotidyltransferase domain-containing protein [Thermoplasmata archaeon]|jgi:predicted nucleotidyltransferase
MKFNDALDPLLTSPSKLRLLRTLLPTPNRRWTGRELAAVARVSTAQAARDLNDFLDVGVVLRDVVGKSYSWRVNELHILVPEVSRLLDFESRVRETLLQDVGKELIDSQIRRAVLFGSVSRGDERSDSDVDLLIEIRTPRDRSSAESAIEKVRERVWDRYGNPVSALVYTTSEMRNPPNPPLIDSINREGLPVRAGQEEAHGED